MKDDIRMNLVTPREDESLFLERAVKAPFRDTSHRVVKRRCRGKSRLSAISVHAYDGRYTHSVMSRSARGCSATVHRIENGHVETIDGRFF